MNLGEILEGGANPADFWARMIQAVSDQWQLTQCVALQIDGDAIKLFGSSEGSNLRTAPQNVRKAIMADSSEVQVIEISGVHWVVHPMNVVGFDMSFVLVFSREFELLEPERIQIRNFVESAVTAFSAQRKADASEKSLSEISKVVDLGLIIGESAHFGEAANRLCNELETELAAMRVTLGWRKKGLMELISTNHGGRIRNDTETAGALGRAMDEAAEQD